VLEGPGGPQPLGWGTYPSHWGNPLRGPGASPREGHSAAGKAEGEPPITASAMVP